jgi:hypothetical protein
MTKPVALDQDARDEVDQALAFTATLGQTTLTKFRHAIVDLWQLLEANPAIGSKVSRSSARLFPMVGYPYYAVYTEEPNRIRVYAFANTNRKPNYWKKRLRNP